MINFKIKTLLILLFFLIATSLFAEERPVIQWSNTYGDGVARSIQQTSDGGFIVCGDSAYQKMFVRKLDSYGKIIWTKTFVDEFNCFAASVQQTSDGGYIVCGSRLEDLYIVKLSSNGDSLWAKGYWGSLYNVGVAVRQTFDGGYISVGTVATWWTTICLYKTDSDGDSLWSTFYNPGIESYTGAESVQLTSDGGYIIAGGVIYGSPGYSCAYLIKTDSLGDDEWVETYGCMIEQSNDAVEIQQTLDGGFIVAILRASGGGFQLLKTDSIGDSIWARTYNGTIYNQEGDNLLQKTPENGFVVTGQKDGDVYLLKTDSIGDTLWTGKYGDGIGHSVYCTSDGGYVIAGEQNGDFLVTKLIPSYLLLQNDTVAIGDTNIYVARDSIKAAGSSSTPFVIAGNGSTGGYCTMEAGILIRLKPGFKAQTGSLFVASIDSLLSGGLSAYGSPLSISLPKDLEVKKEPLPTVFSCSQNSPNPFNMNTTIKYGLPKDSDVKLTVFNIAGQAVKTLVNAQQSAGFKSVSWDGCTSSGTAVPQGIYFYKFQAGDDFGKTYKMIVLR